MASETTPLVTIHNHHTTSEEGQVVHDFTSGDAVSKILLVSQIVFLLFFGIGVTSYDLEKEYDAKEYIVFRDIMAMLLLGFGYLMTFLKSYGLGAVGFTMMLSILAIEANILIEHLLRCMYESDEDLGSCFPLKLGMANLIDAEFAAATMMITFGALIGNATPLQLVIICFGQSFFYSVNKVFGVLGFVGAEDVGGSMTIHMFGAYFGLACSYAMGPPQETIEAGEPDKVSDLFALIGTSILWIFWPSFVGATETGVAEYELRCVINTICALLASTSVTFYLSHKLTGYKFDPVHVANSTLAGGVAIGSSGRLNIGPGYAMLLGAIAGAVSVLGYVYSTPLVSSKYRISDTCGVGNLHGYPSLVGGLLSIAYIALDPGAEFLQYSLGEQMLRQFLGVVCTLAVSILSGYGMGLLIAPLKHEKTPCFLDSAFWHSEYFDHKHE